MTTTKDIIKMIFDIGYEYDIRNNARIYNMIILSWSMVHDMCY